MNGHTKARIKVLRTLAQLGESWLDSEADTKDGSLERKQMRDLVEELRDKAAYLETAEPDPHARRLRARAERMKDLVGRKVRSLRTIRTKGGAEYPVGTVWTIDGHWRGKVHITNGWWYPWDKSIPPFRVEDREQIENERGEGTIGGFAGYLRRVDLDDLELLPLE